MYCLVNMYYCITKLNPLLFTYMQLVSFGHCSCNTLRWYMCELCALPRAFQLIFIIVGITDKIFKPRKYNYVSPNKKQVHKLPLGYLVSACMPMGFGHFLAKLLAHKHSIYMRKYIYVCMYVCLYTYLMAFYIKCLSI